MAGTFHIYYAAAKALWDMKTQRLEAMTREGGSPALRRAATTTLRLKASFVTPEEFGDERSIVTKLAAMLSDDREFTMDMALRLGGSSQGKTKVLVQSGVARPTGLSKGMWIAISAAVILLVLDVLATAGVPVPTPIGDVIDRFSGADESPVTPAPLPPGSRPRSGRDPEIERDSIVITAPEPRATTSTERDRRATSRKETTSAPRSGDKIRTQARGRELHQAQGRELHQAQGRELHQAQGKKLHQAQGRDRQPPAHSKSGKKLRE